MRHRVKGNELNIDSSHRKALNRFMATSFIEKGSITTTVAKAKFIQPFIEKLVTKAKKKDLSSFRTLTSELHTKESVDKLSNLIAPKLMNRQGGYTRITKLSSRVGDNAPMARLEWVEVIEEPSKKEKSQAKEKTKKSTTVKKATKKVSKAEVKESKNE